MQGPAFMRALLYVSVCVCVLIKVLKSTEPTAP